MAFRLGTIPKAVDTIDLPLGIKVMCVITADLAPGAGLRVARVRLHRRRGGPR
jgi:hypothetical protein